MGRNGFESKATVTRSPDVDGYFSVLSVFSCKTDRRLESYFFAQLSFNEIVRLNTNLPGVLSFGSGAK